MELYVRRLLPSLPPHLLVLIITAWFAFLFPCSLCLDAQYEYCQNTSKCGDMNITYPFGVGNRGCGFPSFQIDCVQNSAPVITIHSRTYTILGLHLRIPLLIASGDTCQFLDDDTKMHIPSSAYGDTVFNITGKENRTLTVYECYKHEHDLGMHLAKCNASFYWALYARGYPDPGCSKKQVLTEVGRTVWVFNDTKRNESCRSCQACGGICGYNISDSTAAAPFVCYCKDGPRTHECLGNGPRNKASIIIIGCSIGGAALTAIALVLFLMFYVKRKAPPGRSLSKVEKFLKEYAYEMPMPIRYSQSDLKKITNNFVEKLGEGGFGVVYKGLLRNGALVAVKLLDRQRHSETQFMNEVATIGRVHHFNLVRLLGYCFESPTSALVYEYMVNGSLEKFIFAEKGKGQVLRWEQLYSIALGAARGIAYLHQDCDKRIVHFDIKPHNILLNAEFTPKVCDFGLAKLCGKGDDHISMTTVRGTPGYVAPEVCGSDMSPITDKSDVYSFGMLLLEIVGGRKNFDVQVSHASRLYFPEWMLESQELGMKLEEGKEGKIEAEDEEKARRLMTKIGFWCIQYKFTNRPCMSRVVQMLEGNGEDVGYPPFPFHSSSVAPELPLLSFTENTSSFGIKS